MNSDLRQALLRTLAFQSAWRHAPTVAEWIATLEIAICPSHEELGKTIEELVVEGIVKLHGGRYFFADENQFTLEELQDREFWMPRKLKRARRVAAWLARLSSVRFVALCNTTALGHARDGGDLDFFIVVRQGTLMTTRGVAALPFKLLNRRPQEGGEGERDAVCLSYFVTDAGLDLTSHMLQPDDPYFRYWFLSLLPLYDDGVSQELWRANRQIVERHACAEPWLPPPDIGVDLPRLRFPVPHLFESSAAKWQTRFFPNELRRIMNRDSNVLVTSDALKLHVADGRMKFRERYEEICRQRGII